MEKVIYYTDELNDEFAGDNIKAIKINGKYKYIRKSFFKKITHFFWYRVIATPLAFMYLKIKFRHKIVNKKVLKGLKKGYFLFGNHTQNVADALIPSMISIPKDAYVIVHANNVSMPYLGKITPSLGAIPLPDNLEATKNFIECLKYHSNKKRVICIYPEAHIWPYYTKIRPFKDLSFRYPVEFNKPVIAFTNVYLKRKHSKNPKIVTYLDGPFYPNLELSKKEAKEELRNQVYNTMVERSKLNNIEIIRYEKREQND